MAFDPNYIAGLAGALNRSSATEQDLITQLSSGLRVASPSSDPVAAAQAARFGSVIAVADRFAQTSASTSSLLQVTDSTLGEVVTQVTQALTLTTQGANGTLNAGNLQAIATELTGIRDSILGLANTSYQGQTLFGGSLGGGKPFVLNTSVNPATVAYTGDTVVRSITTPTGQQLAENVTGGVVFQPVSSDVFGALNVAIAQFQAGDASNAAALTAQLTASLANISTHRSVIGTSLSRLQATSTYEATAETEVKSAQSGLVSANTAQVATGLSVAETQNQALLSVIATLSKAGTLFDRL